MKRTATRMVRLAHLVGSFLMFILGACGAVSPNGIHYACAQGVRTCELKPSDLDTLADAATRLTNAPKDIWASQWVEVTFTSGVIEIGGEEYAGTTLEQVIQVIYEPSVYSPSSALLHELVHEALYLRTGDYDNGHTGPEWAKIEQTKQELSK